MVGQQALKLLAGVLRSLVRVMQPRVGTNRYSSAFNDPVNKLDPDGNAVPIAAIAIAAVVAWSGSLDYANAPTSGSGGDGSGGGSDTYSRSTLDMASTMVGGAGAPAARGIFRSTRELARRGAERFPHASAAASAALAIDSMGEPGGGFGAGTVVRTTVQRGSNVGQNAADGARRHAEAAAEMQARYPNASIQNERNLYNHNGARAIDRVTGTGRRLDCCAVENGRVLEVREVTSPTANKTVQTQKEERIIQNGGTFIRDQQTGRLIDITGTPRITDRRR